MTLIERLSYIFTYLKCFLGKSGQRKLLAIDRSILKVEEVLDVQSLMETHNLLRQMIDLILSPY